MKRALEAAMQIDMSEFRLFLEAAEEVRDWVEELNKIKANVGDELQFLVDKSGHLQVLLHGDRIDH